MPVTQMRNGLTAEKSIFSQKPNIKVPRSRFDYSQFKSFTSDIGMIVPVDVIPTLPNEDYNLYCQYKIDFRPLLVPTLTSYKVKIHYYYCPNQYLWSGWESFISKGRSGKLSLTVPSIKLSELVPTYDDSGNITSCPSMYGLTDSNFTTSSGSYYPYTPHSLLSYICGSPYYNSTGDNVNNQYLPYFDTSQSLKGTGWKKNDVNALPFLMYQKIYRSNYIDPNLYSNGTVKSDVWFPDDIDSSDWRFDYALTNIGGTYNHLFVPQRQVIPSDASSVVANFVPIPNPVNGDETGDNVVNLTQLRYSMYTDDMFTTALPFLQRGLQTDLDIDITQDSGSILSTFTGTGVVRGSDKISVASDDNDLRLTGSALVGSSDIPYAVIQSGSGSYHYSALGFADSASSLYPAIPTGTVTSTFQAGTIKGVFTAEKLRSLIALSVWQERNSLTNGSYGQFIKVHFDKSPNNQYCEPIYIGGTTSLFNVNAVVQTSESGTTPQGNPSGIGGSSNNQSIGSFHSNDFGFIMVLMTIIPDTIYAQSTEHWEFDLSPDDYYMPEYEQLSYQPILNKQLFTSGIDKTDNDLFGYSNRYVYLKQRDSVARGMLALPANVDAYYNSYVQKRLFSDTPKLSQQFVTCYPPNIDRSMLAYPGQPAFIVQFYSGANVVKPLSYVAQPNTFGF